MHAGEITFGQFWSMMWRERREMLRDLRWAGRMSSGRDSSASAKKYYRRRRDAEKNNQDEKPR
jgi:hypothetical protein